MDSSTDRTADLQEALISANLAFKEKEENLLQREEALKEREENFRQREEAFKEKEESVRQKDETFRQREDALIEKEEKLIAREKLLKDKEAQIAEKANELTGKEKRLEELQKILNERQISFEQKPIKSLEESSEIIEAEIITAEKDIPSELLSRLEKMESIIRESVHKDKIIRELHEDLQQKNRNFYAELTRPVIKSIIRIYSFVVGTLKAANQKEGEDPEVTFKRLRQAVESNCLMIEDLLNDEFNIIMFTPEKGDVYLPKEHTAILSIDTEDPELAGTIQECRQAGFKEFETGRIVKSAVVTVYKMKKK